MHSGSIYALDCWRANTEAVQARAIQPLGSNFGYLQCISYCTAHVLLCEQIEWVSPKPYSYIHHFICTWCVVFIVHVFKCSPALWMSHEGQGFCLQVIFNSKEEISFLKSWQRSELHIHRRLTTSSWTKLGCWDLKSSKHILRSTASIQCLNWILAEIEFWTLWHCCLYTNLTGMTNLFIDNPIGLQNSFHCYAWLLWEQN